MAGTDPWAQYADSRDRCIRLLRSLDAEQAATRVPFSPEWTVADVASHLCGLNAEVASGRLVGLGTDERTAHQVGARRGRSLDEICDEWLSHEDVMQVAIAAAPFFGTRLAADLIVHLHDIRHALGLAIDRDDEATASAAHCYALNLEQRVRERLGTGIEVALSDGTRFSASGNAVGAPVSLRATPYDFLRSVTGRRSRRQIETLDWVGDPTEILDQAWSSYGALPTDDVEV